MKDCVVVFVEIAILFFRKNDKSYLNFFNVDGDPNKARIQQTNQTFTLLKQFTQSSYPFPKRKMKNLTFFEFINDERSEESIQEYGSYI